jgi:hypothetical protein
MELTTLMLADAAQQTNDGKVHVLGGQWDRIVTAALPTTHPSLAVVLAVRVEYSEAMERHEIRVELTKDGALVGPAVQGHIQVGHPPTLTRGASQSTAIALTFPLVTFPESGRYEWTVRIDNQVHGSIPLEVIESSQLPGFPLLPAGPPQ